MSQSHRKSIIRQTIERFDRLMAIGQSRQEAKQNARLRAALEGRSFWSYSTGLIHSHKTRTTYQEQTLRFVNWARTKEGMTSLEALDACADALVSRYLQEGIEAGKSPYTLQLQRSALRLFFADRGLAEGIPLPIRRREAITRSRRPAARDRHFQPAHWQPLLNFQRAVGLRRGELQRLCVQDISSNSHGKLVAHVSRGKGSKEREVEVVPGREQDVLCVVQGRVPDERIFPHLPDMDLHALRREYAQSLYLVYAAPGFQLPSSEGRLLRNSYDEAAVQRVARALGHNRSDVVLRHYLR